ncbi:FadR/GntR family transcriptional regulator [Pelomonas sp. CA6]|uniref:FadR/GntR family transcriptional regulator n=1 Tax=Pelomonas sp. CA6 TaxID=2907999 RepID=UPI002407EF82|nr:FCD domain-containing protein [Pelomonas sp. CA6]
MVTRLPTYRQAQIDIKLYIEKNGLKPGDALPTEDRFAEELGVSRLSLREALKALDSLGIVESRHGDGVYVKAFSFDAILDNLPYAMGMTREQVDHLVYARAYLEMGAVPDVMRYIQPENLRRLRELAETMQQKARQGESFTDADHAFHVEMYRCLDNPFLNSLIDLFWRAFNRMNAQDRIAPVDQATLLKTAQDHLGIVEMLEQRDMFGLMSAHRRHFEQLFSAHPVPSGAASSP